VKLSVIVVNYNTAKLLPACLTSLQRLVRPSLEVIVVDNASKDGSADIVRETFPWVELVALDKNLGYAAGNNLGIEKATGDLVLLLNPDTEITQQALDAMIERLEQEPSVGAVGPVLLNTDGSVQRRGYYRRFPSLLQVLLFYTVLVRISARSRRLVHRLWEAPFTRREVDQIPGACLMVKRTVIDQVGLLDAGFFLWFDDVDWCFRMNRAGWRLEIVEAARVLHHGGQSFSVMAHTDQTIQFFDSMLRFFRKHHGQASARAAKWILRGSFAYSQIRAAIEGLTTAPPRRRRSPERIRAVRRALRTI
jgi:N-acetylglucosaminyl-diphospho-decaprenol L-rhamnosyltransferase